MKKLVLNSLILISATFGQNPNRLADTAAFLPVGTSVTNNATAYFNGGTATFPDNAGTQAQQWEVAITGTAPGTTAITIQGCMRGNTCSTVASSTNTSSIVLSSAGLFDRYTAAVSWTGGDSTTRITVNRTSTVSRFPSQNVIFPGAPTGVCLLGQTFTRTDTQAGGFCSSGTWTPWAIAAGATGFNSVTPGTNNGALVIGTGGSLTTSGTGTNIATGSTGTQIVQTGVDIGTDFKVKAINGQNMAALGTGLTKNTTGTGVPSIAVAADLTALGSVLQNGAGNLGFLGSIQTGQSPFCFVDGVSHLTILDCINGFAAIGVDGTGTIYSNVPEDFTTNYFSTSGFSGLLILNNDLGTSSSQTCNTIAPFNCWITEVPLLLPSKMQIRGTGFSNVIGMPPGGLNNGTAISFGASFPASVGVPPPQPTATCVAGTGSLTAGDYLVQVAYVNDLKNGVGTKIPGYGLPSPESATVTCSGGQNEIDITVTNPAAKGSGYAVQELKFYTTEVGGASGTELGANPIVGTHCAGGSQGNGVIDTLGSSCKLPVTGAETVVYKVATTGGDYGPALVDLTNPLIIMLNGQLTKAMFDVQLRDLTVNLNPSNNGSNNRAANQPGVGIWNAIGNEQSGLRDIAFIGGACDSNGSGTHSGAQVYVGPDANNSFIDGYNSGSSAGPGNCSGNWYDIVYDARGKANSGTSRTISNSTVASRCTGCPGLATNSPTKILVTGSRVALDLFNIHGENTSGGGWTGGDIIQCTNGARCNISATTGTEKTNSAMVHATSTSGVVCAFAGNGDSNGSNHFTMKDDINGISLDVGATASQQTTPYCTVQWLANLFLSHVSTVTSTFAPSASSTGTGTIGLTTTMETGSNDTAGSINISTGLGAVSSGTVTLTFGRTLGTNNAKCTGSLLNGGQTWNARATLIGTTPSTSSFIWNWDNNSVSLASSQPSAYKVIYHCIGA